MASDTKSNASLLDVESKTPSRGERIVNNESHAKSNESSRTEHHTNSNGNAGQQLRQTPPTEHSKSTPQPPPSQHTNNPVTNLQPQSRSQTQQQQQQPSQISSSQNNNQLTPSPTIQSTSSTTQISASHSPSLPKNSNSLPPIQNPPPSQQQSRSQPQNSYNSQPAMSSKANSNASLFNGRRPHRLEPIDTQNKSPSQQSVVKPISYYGGANNSKSNDSFKRSKQNTSTSLDGTKKIVRWHLWWDGSQSNLRVPSYELPPRQVPSKIGSLNNINYKPGGGNMAILNEKLEWNKRAKIDHIARGYKPGGGNMSILNEKLNWNTESKIGSLANVNHKPGGGNISIIDMPFDKSTARSKIDSGFVFEEVIVPTDYVLNSPRPSHLDSFRGGEPSTGRRSKA